MEKVRKLIKELENQKNDLADALVAGQATDWAHYKEIVGKGKGIGDAIEQLKGILKNDEDED